MSDSFPELVHALAPDVGALERRQFLILEVDVGQRFEPYAQVARELDDTWYCEVVSSHYLAADEWPIDEFFLMSAGWSPPVDPRDNWSITGASADVVVRLMVEALRFGRSCPDPFDYTWSVGRFPPDDGGAEPELPVEPRGPFGLAA